jgi:hypothetical protein
MTDINVVWLNHNEGSPNKGYWSYGWLEETLTSHSNASGATHSFISMEQVSEVPTGQGAIVVIPAEYNAPHIAKINDDLATLPWVVLVLASDEQGLFSVEDLAPHPNLKLWVMTPHFDTHVYPEGTQFLGVGYPQDARSNIAKSSWTTEREYLFGFSGQITHERRIEMAKVFREIKEGYLNETAGFTQGLARQEYYQLLTKSLTVPAPSGPVTLDSFRAYEALEAGAIPILDGVCPVKQEGIKYWDAVLPNHPLPIIQNWSEAQLYLDEYSSQFPTKTNSIFSWWQMFKRDQRNRLLAGVPNLDHDDITFLVPTSPIPSHPSLDIITETLDSIRFHFPRAHIIIMCDGVREEQNFRTEAYEEYLQILLHKCNTEWAHTYPLVFNSFQHQANMTREALKYVTTPLVSFVEHDTPFIIDRTFDWPSLIKLANSNDIDMIRFHFEAHIHPEHEHLTLDPKVVTMHGVRRTLQWSQRPHIAKTEYYRSIINEHFPITSRTMIEDKMHSVAQCEPNTNRIAIYHPEGSIVRSRTTDGRQTDPKYDMVFE